MHRDGVTILLTAVQPKPMSTLLKSGLVDTIGSENFCASIDQALERARQLIAERRANESD